MKHITHNFDIQQVWKHRNTGLVNIIYNAKKIYFVFMNAFTKESQYYLILTQCLLCILFVCSLFNDAFFCDSDHIASNTWLINE
jgi:hypothetical protein